MARILIVDDDPQVIDRLRQLLADEHDLACTGDWTQVSRLYFQQPCDLVLMDVNLPRLKGDQLVEILRRMPARADAPPARLVSSPPPTRARPARSPSAARPTATCSRARATRG